MTTVSITIPALPNERTRLTSPKPECFSLESFPFLKWTLTLFGFWRPNMQKRYIPWQIIVLLLSSFFFFGFLVAFGCADQLNSVFSQFPIRFGQDWGTFISALCLNSFPPVCFIFGFLYFNHHLHMSNILTSDDTQCKGHFQDNLQYLQQLSEPHLTRYYRVTRVLHISLLLPQLLIATAVNFWAYDDYYLTPFRFLYWFWEILWFAPPTGLALVVCYTLQVHIAILTELKEKMDSQKLDIVQVKPQLLSAIEAVNKTGKEFQLMIIVITAILLGAVAGFLSEVFVFNPQRSLKAFFGYQNFWGTCAAVLFLFHLMLMLFKAGTISAIQCSLVTSINQVMKEADEENVARSLLANRLQGMVTRESFQVYGVPVNMKTFFGLFGVLGTVAILTFQQIVK